MRGDNYSPFWAFNIDCAHEHAEKRFRKETLFAITRFMRAVFYSPLIRRSSFSKDTVYTSVFNRRLRILLRRICFFFELFFKRLKFLAVTHKIKATPLTDISQNTLVFIVVAVTRSRKLELQLVEEDRRVL